MSKKLERNRIKMKYLAYKGVAIVLLYAIILIITKWIFVIGDVSGESMEPTLFDGYSVLCWRNPTTVSHGDIVILKRGTGESNLVKRVIATEGDTIEIKDNTVILNGETLDEPYIAEAMVTDDMEETTIEEGKVFVMGDNRNNSYDSRVEELGQVSVKDQIFGVSFASLTPTRFLIICIVILCMMVIMVELVFTMIDRLKESKMKELGEEEKEC